MNHIEISKVEYHDLVQIVVLQNRLILSDTVPEDGFLVSGYRERDYKKFLKRGEILCKAVDGDRIVGAMVVLRSTSIVPEDVNNSLLKYTVNKDFLLVKQVFVAPEYGRCGIAGRFYTLLSRLNVNGLPIVAVVVRDPPNVASRNFHSKMGFTEYLEFLPSPDKDGIVRLRSAYILPARKSADFHADVRLHNIGGNAA